jgi:hypothetical protein
MTSPGDDDLEVALRRALSAAASEVEPGADGLDKIRARIGGRQPRPWLFSVLSGVVDRVRHWTWDGHWAWRDSPARLRAFWERRSRWSKFPRRDIGWLRLVTALAGVALIAGVMLGVQPVRQAILQARTSMDGGSGSPRGNVGTEGNGTRAGGGGAPTADSATPGGGGPTGQAGSAVVPGASPTPAAHSASSTGCVSTVLPVVADAEPSQASAAPEASGTASAAQAPASASPTSSSATPAQLYYTNTNANTDAPTCPVAPLTGSPTPTPAGSSSPAPAPSDVPSTPAYTPPTTDPSQEPTPTPTAGSPSPTDDPPSRRPSDPPTSGRPGKPGRPHRPHHESGDGQSGDGQSGRR